MLLTRRATKSQRGAALVEMAIALPLLLMLVFGIIEFGLAFNVRLTVGNATQSAARVGSAIGSGPRADMEILGSLEQGVFQLPGNGQDIITEVWVFGAPSSGNAPATCNSGPCNKCTYDPTLPGCKWIPCPNPDPPTNYSGWSWPPDARDTTVGELDDLGVVVFFSHDWIVGSFLPMADVPCTSPPNGCWRDTAIMRLEPQQFGIGG
jgi:hypothetical protein